MSRMTVLRLVARRIAAFAAVLLIISLGVFALQAVAPGSPEQTLLGTRPSTPELREAIRSQFHLDDPFFVRYWLWLKDAVHLDFGQSTQASQPVLTVIGQRLAVTVFLGIYAFVLVVLLGIACGVLAATQRGRPADRSISAIALVGISAPAFATGILLLDVFAVQLGWFPAFGAGVPFTDRLVHLTLPALALALMGFALVVKVTRAAVIHALEQDYVAAALARGIPRRRVVVRYGLRNALVPVVTVLGPTLGFMLTGAVLVETTFSLPGLGQLLTQSVNAKDIPVVQGIAVLSAAIVVVVSLVCDVLYMVLDPRIRLAASA